MLDDSVIRIDPGPLRHRGEADHGLPIGSERLAYIMYTSGSTGEPKGAMIEHGGVVRLVCGQDYMPFGPDFHFLFAGPLSFDLSTIEIFTPLLHGAKLLISPDDVLAPETLRRFANDEGLRGICVSFSLFRALFEVDPGAFESIQTIGVCGEPADPRVLRRAQQRLPLASFYNAYGPTECTALSATFQIPSPCPSDPPIVPIGVPLRGMCLRVVGADLGTLPPGEVGELLIGGLGVGRGYLNDPNLTASCFITRDDGRRWYRSGDRVRARPDGVLEYLGRADDQVKVRGQRIELGEIEAALGGDPAVRAAAAVVLGTGVDAYIAACVVAAVGDLDTDSLLQRLRERLMPAMIPAVIRTIADLPINQNGKVDRARIRTLLADAVVHNGRGERENAPAAGSPTEVELCEMVATVIGRAMIDPSQGFVALGGHSLRAMMLSMRVRERWGVSIPIPTVLGEASIAALAGVIDAKIPHANPGSGRAAVRPASGPRPLTPQELRLWTVHHMDPGSAAYNIAYRFRLREDVVDRERLMQAWNKLAERHAVLRTVFSGPDAPRPEAIVRDEADVSVRWVDDTDPDRSPVGTIREPFDLSVAPLARLIMIGGNRPVGYLVMHHIISDAWSMEVMLRDLEALYRSGDDASLPLLPGEASGAEAPDRSTEREDEATAIVEQLRGIPYTGLVPAAGSTGASDLADSTVAPIPADLAARVEGVAHGLGVTPYTVFLAGYAAWIASLTNRERLCIGLFVSTRNDPAMADRVGFHVETVPVVLDAPSGSFDLAIRGLANVVSQARARGGISFDRIADLLGGPRDQGRTPVTDVFFNAIDAAPIDQPPGDQRLIESERSEVEHGLARFGLLTTLYRSDTGDWRASVAVRIGAVAADGSVPSASGFVDHLRGTLEGAGAIERTPVTPPQARPATGGWDGRERRSPERLSRSGHVAITVLSVFREVLSDATIGPGDDFFAKGGNLLHAVRAFSMIRQRLGTNLPTATIFRHPTPERLAAVIRDDPAGLLLRPFFQLTDHPRPRTAYILPGVTGEIISMGNLVRGLGSGWGCFAAAYPGVSERTEPLGSIGALLDHLMSGLGDGFDPGSSAIVGYSFGGVIAYELCMRLQAQGRTPRLLVLLDSHLMTRFPTPGQPVPMLTHIENLRRLRGERRLRYIYRRLLNARRKLLSVRLRGETEFVDLPHIQRLHDSNLLALQGYRPSGEYGGAALVVNGHRPDWMLPEDDDGANGWRSSLTRPPATLRLDAGHVELIRPKFADSIAQRIMEVAELPGTD